MKSSPIIFKKALIFFSLLLLIIVVSEISYEIFGNHSENKAEIKKLTITDEMSVAAYGNLNKISQPALLSIFNIKQLTDTNKNINSFGFNKSEILTKTKVVVAEFEEEHSKNPIRYTIHFILCILFLTVVFYFIRKSKLNSTNRKYFYLFAIIVFGLGFNSSPSPMGPLNDTISLFGNIQEIIHPRLFAILTYLALVIVANKFICSWVCQIGVLQDFIFRINRNKEGNKSLIRQLKMPFILSNSIRISFFIATSVISFLWAINIINFINPFLIFNASQIQFFSWFFIIGIFVISIFIYRPWCYLLCPFGLLSWLFEKLSIYKIRVNFKTCTHCEACTKSCPSDTMKAILAQKKTIPDCFSCGTCMDKCPTHSIKFNTRKELQSK